MMPAEPKVLLVTGGNTGLGYATVEALLQSDSTYRIILCARTQAKADHACARLVSSLGEGSRSSLVGMQLDYASDSSIGALATRVEKEFGHLDVLVNNGGVLLDGRFLKGEIQMTEREMWDSTWTVNVTGPWLLTQALIPLLLRSTNPRILFMTSGLSPLSHQPTTSGANASPPKGWPKSPAHIGGPAYRSAKTGLNQMALQVRRLLREDGVKVIIVNPGVLATSLSGLSKEDLEKRGMQPPSVGGELVCAIVRGERDEDTEKGVVQKDGIQPW